MIMFLDSVNILSETLNKNNFVKISHIQYTEDTTTTPKVMSTHIPTNRPTYKEWVEEMRVNELSWSHSPDGRDRAVEIMSRVGNVEHILTPFERITGIRWN